MTIALLILFTCIGLVIVQINITHAQLRRLQMEVGLLRNEIIVLRGKIR